MRISLVRLLLAAILASIATAARAHSASDAYLTLQRAEGAGTTILHAQWDIALRDLDFVLGLDDDGDGNITWGELRAHQRAIDDYAYQHLRVASGGKGCSVRPTRQMVDDHADGAYAALFFDIACEGEAKRITVDYRLFFAIDPSHRGIFVLRSGASTATALLSPDNAKIEVGL